MLSLHLGTFKKVVTADILVPAKAKLYASAESHTNLSRNKRLAFRRESEPNRIITP